MRVLQIGRDDWSLLCRVPQGVTWWFVNADDRSAFDRDLIGRVDVVILDELCGLDELLAVESLITPYTLIVEQSLKEEYDASFADFFARKAAVYADLADRQPVVDALPRQFFAKPFGQKLEVRKALVSPFHTADAWFEGSGYLTTNVDTASSEQGDDFRQLVTWRENIAYDSARPFELWPEYVKDSGVEIEFRIQLIQSGTPDVIAFHQTYSEADLAEPILIDHPTSGYLACSVFAKGTGQVKVGPIHYRHSRLGAGQFLPGGQRIVDAAREEVFHYFHPGNLQPPLNIYFSGYRPAEGFEGYYMMAGLGHPFVLITDPRLEGGRFYLGSEELEGALIQMIRERIDALGFREQDVIFSGLSMGSFGALYYGSQFNALAIIAGKPIVDLGHVAERGRLVRPREFLTIFDIVNFWNRDGRAGDTVDGFTRDLIARWNGDPGFGDTKILMSYMLQDDYDDEAYYTLLNSQTGLSSGRATTVIARGYQGRHNDDSPSIVAWFSNQYRRIIAEYRENAR